MSKIIEVVKSFKYSMNIKDDFLDIQKLNVFFATQKNSEFIFRTIDNILNGTNKAILLSGAYGTGKSFIVSIIAGLLSGKLDAKKDLSLLIKKLIQQNDSYEKPLTQIQSKRYLIVFPDDAFSDFTQSVCLGISETIKAENLDIVLNSTFSGIIERIERWENCHQIFYQSLGKELKSRKWSVAKLIKKLHDFDAQAYNLFTEIYPDIMGGEKFIPLGGANNIKSVMKEFEQEAQKLNYDGVLYIFDEFGRFLESNIESLDVKKIQDAAEYCNSGAKSAFILISHKDIFQYSKRLHNNYQRDEWEKVSGRFTKTHLVYEESNILNIVESILKKYPTTFKRLLSSNKDIIAEHVEQLEALSIYNPEDMLKAFFPLNYITAVMLPKLSQRLAQNERTLFAFLCGNEPLAFNAIFDNDDNALRFITPDVLYDYFEDNFLFLGTDSREYKVYLNARTLIKTLSSKNNDVKIIKILTLFYLLNEFNELPPNYKFLLFASGLSADEFEQALVRLQEHGAIAYRKHLDRYILSQDIDFNIDADIAKQLNNFDNPNYHKILSSHIQLYPEYPVFYNFHYKITRYFHRYFIDISQLAEIEKYFDNQAQDGVIFYVTNFYKQENIKKTIQQASELFKDAIFILKESGSLDIQDALLKLEALTMIEVLNDTFRSSVVAQEELNHYKCELIDYTENNVNKYWDVNKSLTISFAGSIITTATHNEYQQALSNYLERKYHNFTTECIINYELINKTKLTIPIKNARKEIFNAVINKSLSDEYFSLTGAANSIARITLLNTAIWQNKQIDFTGTRFDNIYNEFITFLNDGPQSYAKVIEYFASNKSAYGFRIGAFSFLMGFILLKNKDSLVISYENNEVAVNSDIMDIIEEAPDKYLITLFNIPENARKKLLLLLDNQYISRYIEYSNQNKDITILLYEAFKKMIFALPKILFSEQALETRVPLQKLITGLEANNSKVFFFQRLPKLYKSNDWQTITTNWSHDIHVITQGVERYIGQIANLTKDALGIHEPSLGLCVSRWIRNLDDEQKQRLSTSILRWDNFGKYGDDELLKQTTSAVRGGIDLMQWRSDDDILDYNNLLTTELQTITNGNEVIDFNESVELTELGHMLKRKLKADIDAFRGISNQEIQNTIVQLLQELNNGRMK